MPDKSIKELIASLEETWERIPKRVASELTVDFLLSEVQKAYRGISGLSSDHLAIPTDYLEFLARLGEGPLSYYPDFSVIFFDAAEVIVQNTDRLIPNLPINQLPDATDGNGKELVLMIGESSNNQPFLLFCNPRSKRFGHIVLGDMDLDWSTLSEWPLLAHSLADLLTSQQEDPDSYSPAEPAYFKTNDLNLLLQELRTKEGWTAHDSDKTEDLIPIDEFKRRLTALYQEHSEGASYRLEVPEEYLEFLSLAGNTWFRHGNQYGLGLWDCDGVLYHTRSNMELYDIPESEPGKKGETWIAIAETGDKRQFFLCCDPASKHYGAIADYEDNTPWLDYTQCYINGVSFTSFLKDVLKHNGRSTVAIFK